MNIELLRSRMLQMGIDAVLITSELNQRYLLDYPFTDGMLLITLRKAYMITDFRYEEEAKKYADPAFEVVIPSPRVAFITDALTRESVRTLGYEDKTMTVSEYRDLEGKYSGVKLVSLGNMLEDLREIKTEKEIELMKEAQSITDRAFTHLLSMITPNMTELEVAIELEFEMRRLGAEGVAFETIAVSGDASALPHGHPRAEKLHKGFLTMDFGAKYKGYCSDMTRTVVIGVADKEIKRLYNTVLQAQEAAIFAIKAGEDCGEMDKVARDIIDGAGYAGCFGHSLGHGVGMFIHENPRMSARSFGQNLVAGQVVTAEPGIYISGKYGCRIEDMLLVTENGNYDFTASRKDLIEIL